MFQSLNGDITQGFLTSWQLCGLFTEGEYHSISTIVMVFVKSEGIASSVASIFFTVDSALSGLNCSLERMEGGTENVHVKLQVQLASPVQLLRVRDEGFKLVIQFLYGWCKINLCQ